MEAFLSGGNILLALLGFAFVIFIHELGHFAFAKWAGVRVEVFSIGFGPIVWSRTIGETRYALSLLPLGGYVRMLGHEEMAGAGEDGDDDPASYASKHPGWKAAILFGGVLFNFLSSWLILVALAFYGMPHFPPVVGDIAPTVPTMVDGEHQDVPSPARQLGLQRGDRILAINGERTRDFEDMIFATLTAGTNPVTVTVLRDGVAVTLPENPDQVIRPVYSTAQGKVELGIGLQRSRAISAVQSYGANNDLPVGWEIFAVNGEEVGDISGQMLDSLLLPHIGQQVTLGLQSGRNQQERRVRFAGTSVDMAGLFGLPVGVSHVVSGSAAEEAGVRSGDVILAINDGLVSGVHDLRAKVAALGDQALTLRVLRPGSEGWFEVELDMTPLWDPVNQQYLIGIHMVAQGSGRLPTDLPPAQGGLPSPIAAAGVSGGSVLVDTRTLRNEQVAIRTLPPTTPTRLIPLSEDGWRAMDRFRTVAMISQLAGFRDTPALSRSLLGARIADTGPGGSGHPRPGWLSVETYAGSDAIRSIDIDLTALPSDDRSRLLSLPLGSYIVSTSRLDEQGRRSLEIAEPESGVRPTYHRLEPAPVGVVLAFGIDERPYELESFAEAFSLANHKSMQMIGKTLSLIPKFFQPGSEGGISAEKSLHGPIGIFSELKARLQHLGFPSFLRLVALIGLNLFLINLLPIPITDGGQLVILGVEVAIRRPIPMVVLNIINSIGFALIITLMLFVIGLDLARQIFG